MATEKNVSRMSESLLAAERKYVKVIAQSAQLQFCGLRERINNRFLILRGFN